MKYSGMVELEITYRLNLFEDCLYCKKSLREGTMERVINIHIEKLPEGIYLATSQDVQGLVAQGRTVSETIEIARDVVRKLLEAQQMGGQSMERGLLKESFDYPLIVSA